MGTEKSELVKLLAGYDGNPADVDAFAAWLLKRVEIRHLGGKPLDCACSWPGTRYRNGSGHHTECPAHQRWMERFERHRS